jgi:hypothetical protein
MTRSAEERALVSELLADGLNDGEIARRSGIPRSTIRDWRRQPTARRLRVAPARTARSLGTAPVCNRCAGLRPDPPATAYAYLLGVYLGDGCISRHPRAYRLRLTLDAAYPGIIEQCVTALEVIRPGKRAWTGRRWGSRCFEVSMYWQHWPCLFPQHGPGKKHLRPIRLEPWQGAIVAGNPHLFVRGLVHSDGCRIVADDRGRPSPRYHFSNLSEDIKRLYCLGLTLLGVEWTRPCGQQIAVYRKASVAILDRFVGPKC